MGFLRIQLGSLLGVACKRGVSVRWGSELVADCNAMPNETSSPSLVESKEAPLKAFNVTVLQGINWTPWTLIET